MIRSPPRIVLIGGCSAVGKSTLARSLAEYLGAGVVDTDLFWMVLQRSMPVKHDINLFRNQASDAPTWSLPTDELVDRYLRVSRSVCRAIEVLVAHFDRVGAPAVIEGCWVLPEFAVRSEYAGRRVSTPIHSLFLHESNVDLLRHMLLKRPGPPPASDRTVREAQLAMQWQFGVEVRRQAEALGLPVLDARPQETLVDRALAVVR